MGDRSNKPAAIGNSNFSHTILDFGLQNVRQTLVVAINLPNLQFQL
jgi:hypothetical protein